MKYVGKCIEYLVNNEEKRNATIKRIEFHNDLKKPIFVCVSPFGNNVRLTKDEIYKVLQ